MLCPRWLTTPTQPIAIDDVLSYLVAAIDLPPNKSRVFEIGGQDVVAYVDLIREYAKQKHLRRWLITVPLLTPHLSGLWLALVTPATYRVGRHLIEGFEIQWLFLRQTRSTCFRSNRWESKRRCDERS